MQRISILDFGYVEYIEHMGSDERFIEAARMSVDRGFEGWMRCPTCKVILPYSMEHTSGPGVFCENKSPVLELHDARLLAHLYHNQHTTPFEMGGLVIEVKAPLFVFREWHRHRTQGYNEMSARYVPLPDENYRPEAHDIVQRSLKAVTTANRQASGSGVAISLDNAERWLERLDQAYRLTQKVYEEGIAAGVPKELARLPVTVARYSRMRAVANPLNWLKFLTLRTSPNAQQEIRHYAEAVEVIVAAHFPRTHALWLEGRELWEEFETWRKEKTAARAPKPSAS